jgi:hypothetical protein
MLIFLSALWVAAASAAEISVSVRGLKGMYAASVVVDDGNGGRVLNCNDAGQWPDTGVDGSWSCDPIQTDATKLWLALIADDLVASVGTFRPSTGSEIVIERVGQGARLLEEPPPLEPVQDAIAVGPGTILISRLSTSGVTQAPMLVIETSWGRVEHRCSDDGGLFDAAINDSVYLCYGLMPVSPDGADYSAVFSIRQEDGETLTLAQGELFGGPGIRFFSGDIDGELTPTLEHFVLRVRPEAPPVPEEAAEAPETGGEATGLTEEFAEGLAEPAADTRSQETTEPRTAAKYIADITVEGPDEDAHVEVVPGVAEVPGRGLAEDPVEQALEGISEHAKGPSNAPPASPEFDEEAPVPVAEPGQTIWLYVSFVLAALLGLFWVSRYRVFSVPKELERVSPPRLGRLGPQVGGGPVVLQTEDTMQMLEVLIPELSAHRRVVLLGIDQVPEGLSLGHPVYTVRTPGQDEALAAVSGLLRAPGPPVAVVVVDPGLIDTAPSLSPTPLLELFEALDALTWTLVIAGPGPSPRPELTTWSLSEAGSWQRTRGQT